MRVNLRNKLFIGFSIFVLFVILTLGIASYMEASYIFISNFISHQYSIAKFISFSLDPHDIKRYNSYASIHEIQFIKDTKLINSIIHNDRNMGYIYLLNYNPDLNQLEYSINSKINDRETIWIENDLFGIEFYISQEGRPVIRYNFHEYYDRLSVLTEKNEYINISLENRNNIYQVIIDDQVILELRNIFPLEAHTGKTLLNESNRFAQKVFYMDNKDYKFEYNFSIPNFVSSIPGRTFWEKEKIKTKIKKLIATCTEEIDINQTPKLYGWFSSIYIPIRTKETKDCKSIIIMDINTKTISDFKKNIISLIGLITISSFIITLIVAKKMANYFTKPLEILSKAVNNISLGNFTSIVQINTKDEFENLANKFNLMIKNLQISTDVQKSMINQVIQLNEELERKVKLRTETIQKQAEELEKQIKIAKKIQESLLPDQIPYIKNIELSFKYQPMMGVGGDFIDFYQNRTENVLSLFICDVSGHGVPAAFLATMVKMALQDCYDKNLSSESAIIWIHKNMKNKLSGHFLSAIFLKIDLLTGKMWSTNAGHSPIIILKKNGTIEFVQSKGRVISESFAQNCTEQMNQLLPGDKIVLYTDGIIEARNKITKEMYGEDRLNQLLLENSNYTSKELCEIIYTSVLKFTHNFKQQFEDDITIIAVEYSGNQNLKT